MYDFEGFEENGIEREVTPSPKKPRRTATATSSEKATHKKKELDADDKEHMSECKLQNCIRCKFAKNKHKWLPQLPFIPNGSQIDTSKLQPDRVEIARGSWARCVTLEEGDETVFAMWCVPCGTKMLGKAAQICNLLGHQKSRKHADAVMDWVGCALGPTGRPVHGAPDAEEFRQAWDMVSKGTAPSQGLHGIGQHWKLRRMLYCLAEAVRHLDREHVKDSVVSLARDERHAKLLIKFTAVTTQLRVRSGVLWQVSQCPGSAESLKTLTIGAIEKFSTALYGAPQRRSGAIVEAAKPDTKLIKHIIESTEVIRVDAASNEICSCHLLQSCSFRVGDEEVKFSKMIIARDKSHGSRRSPVECCCCSCCSVTAAAASSTVADAAALLLPGAAAASCTVADAAAPCTVADVASCTVADAAAASCTVADAAALLLLLLLAAMLLLLLPCWLFLLVLLAAVLLLLVTVVVAVAAPADALCSNCSSCR
jgi:hypothetical protein